MMPPGPRNRLSAMYEESARAPAKSASNGIGTEPPRAELLATREPRCRLTLNRKSWVSDDVPETIPMVAVRVEVASVWVYDITGSWDGSKPSPCDCPRLRVPKMWCDRSCASRRVLNTDRFER